MKFKYHLLVLVNLSLYCLISCRTIPMYTEINPTLLVGEVIFKTNMKELGILSDGINISGIEILLKNTTTNENIRFSTDKNGLLLVNLQYGKYKIEELYIKKQYNDGTWFDFYIKQPTIKVLEIENGKVNNIGTLQWSFMNRMHNLVQVDNTSEVKNKFIKRFPESNWNQKEWEYKQLAFDIIEPSEPIYNEINPNLLVGEVVFTGSNFVSENGVSLEGITTSGIELVLKNTNTNETLRFPADKNGLFYINLQAGKYRIDELNVRKYSKIDENWFDFYIKQPTMKVLEIEKGKVNNIGTMQWSFVDKMNNLVQVDNESEVKIKFSERFPESYWNSKVWEYQQLAFDIIEPSEPVYNEINPTLLVGEVVFTGSNFVSENGVSLEGITTSGIELVLKNTSTNEILRFPADKNGLFYINLQAGKYRIDELNVRKYSKIDENWFDFYIKQPTIKVLEIEKGKVNNIGTLQWSFVDKMNNLVQVDNESEVKIKFSERFPESYWNQEAWKYKKLFFEFQ